MAPSYDQLATRLSDLVFQNQCLWSVLFLMRYIHDESEATPNHTARIAWVHAAMANPFSMARNMASYAISDPACINDIPPTDVQVKAAIESIVNIYTQ